MKDKYKKYINDLSNSPEYLADVFSLELIDDFYKLMKDKGLSQKKLANKLGTSEAYISRVLNGFANLSIESISKISFALDAAPHIHIAERNIIVEWTERPTTMEHIPMSFIAHNEVPIATLIGVSFFQSEEDAIDSEVELFAWENNNITAGNDYQTVPHELIQARG